MLSKPKTTIGLLLLYLGLVMNWDWIWGLFFLFWAMPGLLSGETYFVEPVKRSEHPFLYWLIIFTWLGLAIYILWESISVVL